MNFIKKISDKNFLSFCINQFILLFIIFVTFGYFYINLQTNLSSQYAYNELFINYQSGLIRRGLLGEIFWFFNQYFSTDPVIFFTNLFLFLHLMQIYLFYKIFTCWKLHLMLTMWINIRLKIFRNLYKTKDCIKL